MRLISDEALAVVTIYQEARGESFTGQCAVGEVIRNRMARRYSSDGTVAGTVCRNWQFSGWNNGDPNRIPSLMIDDTSPIVANCVKAWRTSQATTYARGAVLYYNPAIVKTPPDWAKEEKHVATIGAHKFFID